MKRCIVLTWITAFNLPGYWFRQMGKFSGNEIKAYSGNNIKQVSEQVKSNKTLNQILSAL